MLDLDGVVWLSDRPIAGSAVAVHRLRSEGERVVVVTNNSSLTLAQYLDKLERMGVPTAAEDLITSAQVAAGLVDPGTRALVVGGDGIREALAGRDVDVVDGDGRVDTVVVGWTRAFDYDVLTRAMLAVRAGARLLGTNHDPTLPTPDGVLPGGGTLATAIAYASGVEAMFAGKPNQPTVDAARARFGAIEVMVGDQPSTDGVLARRLGARWALVLTGVTKAGDLPVDPQPDIVAASLAALVAQRGT
ncbi:MAG TPA: HAD-IIA family hydrolase [Acidimicrobiales bacterium]|nr:HAD-IIA family hydrolase [Acidimicrobiales bacterium]